MRFTFYKGGEMIDIIFASNIGEAIKTFFELGFADYDEIKVE